jgi:hypothetical protein
MNDAEKSIQDAIAQLELAGAAAEVLAGALVPMLANANRISGAMGRLYAAGRGSAIEALKEQYGLSMEQAIDATAGMDPLAEKIIGAAISAYAISKQG